VLLKPETRHEYLRRNSRTDLSYAEQSRAIGLLEMQRYALLMFTSCGWFFSDVGGIETLQILKYAARVIELMEELQLASPRKQFLEILSGARSNLSEKGTAADIFTRLVAPVARQLS
jgi:hypothetical protein